MLCVSISYAVSSCTSRSVSYSDKNSEMHTQTKVVFSYTAENTCISGLMILQTQDGSW